MTFYYCLNVYLEFKQNGTRSIGCYWRLDRSREPDKEKSRKRQREGTIRRRANTDQPEARNEALRVGYFIFFSFQINFIILAQNKI